MTPVITYTLTQQCGSSRPFCRPCSNSFTVQSCGPTHCEVEPPSQICVEPGIEFQECVTSNCGQPLQLILRDFVIDDSFPEVEFGFGSTALVLDLFANHGEAVHAAWDGDWLLSNTLNPLQSPCAWIGERTFVVISEDESFRVDWTCEVQVVLEDGGSPPGLCWRAQYVIGYIASEPPDPPMSPISLPGVKCTSGKLYQDPVMCEGSFNVVDWMSTLGDSQVDITPVGETP